MLACSDIFGIIQSHILKKGAYMYKTMWKMHRFLSNGVKWTHWFYGIQTEHTLLRNGIEQFIGYFKLCIKCMYVLC